MRKEPLDMKGGGKGRFIVFEGIDGAGKTTQAKRLAAALEGEGGEAAFTREPTGGRWGRKIREIAGRGRAGISLEEELEWFVKDREEHVGEVIFPALKAGRIVVCDRYYYSTMAYQGALGLDPERIREINEREYGFPRPDLVIYVDIDPVAGLERIEKGREGGANTGFEKKEYLEKVRNIFLGIRDENFRRVSGAGTEEEVFKEIKRIVDRELRGWRRC